MSDLRTIENIFMEIGKGAEIVALAVPAGGGLSADGLDTFPQFFRGYVTGKYPHLPLPNVEEIQCPYMVYEGANLALSKQPRIMFRVEGCPLDILEDFVAGYEGRNGTSGSDDELILVTVTADWGEPLEETA